MPPRVARFLDLSAVSLSGLCLVHCLALPVLAVFLPALSIISGIEWLHMTFAVCALPTTVMALWLAHKAHPVPFGMIALAALGLAGLFAGAFKWPTARWETVITVCGGLMLASAHLWNWRNHQSAGC